MDKNCFFSKAMYAISNRILRVNHGRWTKYGQAIKTRGESVAVVLGLIGARPVTEGTGRVARYDAWHGFKFSFCNKEF